MAAGAVLLLPITGNSRPCELMNEVEQVRSSKAGWVNQLIFVVVVVFTTVSHVMWPQLNAIFGWVLVALCVPVGLSVYLYKKRKDRNNPANLDQ
jgi:hypothetical protein